jgi:hypothetical protein
MARREPGVRAVSALVRNQRPAPRVAADDRTLVPVQQYQPVRSTVSEHAAKNRETQLVSVRGLIVSKRYKRP